MTKDSLSIRPDTLDRQRFASAVREALFRKQLTQKELARRLDVSQPTVSGWVNAQKTPGRDNLLQLIEELELEARDVTSARSLSGTDADDDALPLPRVDVHQIDDAGDELPVDGYLIFSRAMLQYAAQAPTDDLMVMTIVGDSMTPEIPPGTAVVFARTDAVGDHGLYALIYDGALMVKTVQRFAGGALKLSSTNPAYDAETLIPDTDAADGPLRTYTSKKTGLSVDVRIVGKVACYMKPV